MSGDGNRVPSATEEAQAQLMLMREQAKLDADKAAAQKAAADAERAQKVAKATGTQQQRYDSAVGYGNQQVGARGLDQGLVDEYGILDLYRSELDRKRGTFAEDDTNPLFGENTILSDVLSQGTNRYRGDVRNQFEQQAGNAETHFGDTMDDQILEAILGSQRSDIEAQVNAARDRGTLNQTGYNKALERLNQQSLAARSELQDLGMGVLSGYRDQFKTKFDNTLGDINNLDLTRRFDTGSALQGLQSLRDSLGGRLEGDLYRATSGQSFFDPNSIISYGSGMQGFYNPSQKAPSVGGDPSLLSAFVDPKKKPGTTLTGTQGTGVF